MIFSFSQICHNNNWLLIGSYEYKISGGPKAGCSPPHVQNFCNFMQFFGKFGKIVGWRPSQEGWCPLLQGIIDKPLKMNINETPISDIITLRFLVLECLQATFLQFLPKRSRQVGSFYFLFRVRHFFPLLD